MPRQKTPLGRAFGRSLRSLREDAALTQEDLCAKIDYSRVQIAYWETGISTPSLEALIRLEKVFGLPAGDLVRRTVESLPRRR